MGRLGADARAEDVRGNTPGHLAAGKGHLAILTLLLQARPRLCLHGRTHH
jgi:ankyrin repeat protein